MVAAELDPTRSGSAADLPVAGTGHQLVLGALIPLAGYSPPTLADRRAALPEVGHDRSASDPRAGAPRSRTGGLVRLHQKRGKLSGLFRGSSHDPDPLLVITPDGAIDYANERQPLTVVNFYDLAGIALRVRGSSFSDSTIVTLDVWIDLQYRDGRKTKWRSTSFADNLQAIQCFIEAYGAYKARQGR
jgi:hypothetical protein